MLAGCFGWDFAFVFICQWPVRPTTTFKPLVIFVHQSVPSISEKKKEEKKRKLSCRLVFEGESLELFLDSELELLW